MSVSFCHKSAPLIVHDFGFFVDMIYAGEVNTSSGTVRQMEFELGWRFTSDDNGCYHGEIPVADLPQLIENCEIALEACMDGRATVTQRIAELRILAKQAMQYNEPITYG